jgi:hypothetical protein
MIPVFTTSVLIAKALRTPKSAHPFPSPKVSWSIFREDIYALFAVAVENLRELIDAFCVVKFCE